MNLLNFNYQNNSAWVKFYLKLHFCNPLSHIKGKFLIPNAIPNVFGFRFALILSVLNTNVQNQDKKVMWTNFLQYSISQLCKQAIQHQETIAIKQQIYCFMIKIQNAQFI